MTQTTQASDVRQRQPGGYIWAIVSGGLLLLSGYLVLLAFAVSHPLSVYLSALEQPLVWSALAILPLATCGAAVGYVVTLTVLRVRGQLTRHGWRISVAVVLVITCCALSAYVSYGKRIRRQFNEATLVVTDRRYNLSEASRQLGELSWGCLFGGGRGGQVITVLPVDRTRIDKVYNRLKELGYDVHYKNEPASE